MHEMSAENEQKKLRSSEKASKMRLLRIKGAAERAGDDARESIEDAAFANKRRC